MPTSPEFQFRRLTDDDLPMLHEWMRRPHVAEWWHDPPSMDELREYLPDFDGASASHSCYLAVLGTEPAGFVQSYSPVDCHADGWWLDERDAGVRGIDVFLADPEKLGRGIGSAMIRAFVSKLFEYPLVTRVQVDPAPNNHRSIRAFELAGFHEVREVDTPDGRALLMYCDREGEALLRCSNGALKAIFFAMHEAHQSGSPSAGPEHLLLGLLRADRSLASMMRRKSMRKRIDGQIKIHRGDKPVAKTEPVLSDAAKRAFLFGAEESNRLQQRQINCHHIVLGLLRDETLPTARVMNEEGITRESVLDALRRAENRRPWYKFWQVRREPTASVED